MDKLEFLAQMGVPPDVIDKLRASEASRVSAPAAAPKAASSSALPQPMLPDCKIVRGKVPGPDNHVLCAKHGHVVDTNTHMIIAHTLQDYKKAAAAKTAANKAAAQAKQAQAAAQKERDVAWKKHGYMKTDVSLIATGVYGPRDGLTIGVIAMPDHGEHGEHDLGAAKFKGKGGGIYEAPHSWLPPGGIMEFTVLANDKQPIKFKTIHFPCPSKGVLRLEAIEKGKISTLTSSRTINKTYAETGGFQASIGAGGPSIGAGAQWQTGGGLGDARGLNETITESSGEFDVKVV